ncbi:ABC transporter permease [Pseudonocardia ailaonensis]|uniref:ABC transporter permease n=1 Tax=Pseudonocardia ailaonensis TaxID=367279 RepID=A0ABN2N4Q2_9PSEU
MTAPTVPVGAPRRPVRPALLTGVAFLVLLAVAVIAPRALTSIDPTAADPLQILQPPGAGHWLGTDQNGRDVFARIVAGARPSVLIGIFSSALALLAGTVLGVLGAKGGRVGSAIVTRLLDIVLAVPGLLLVLLAVAVLGSGTGPAVAGLALVTTPGYARLVRGEVIRLRDAEFVRAAHGLGWTRTQVVLRHVVPNAMGPVTVLATLGIGSTIAAAASLSYLGLGAQEPAAEWGLMLSVSTAYFSRAWWSAVFPGIAITATVLAITVVGHHLQLRFDGRRAS